MGRLLVFTRHPSGLSRDESLLTTLECQVQAGACGPPEQKMHLMISFSRITGYREVGGWLETPWQASAITRVYVLRTSVAREHFDAEQTVLAYKRLAGVERTFRSFKSVDLEVRPIHHRLPNRVRAHS